MSICRPRFAGIEMKEQAEIGPLPYEKVFLGHSWNDFDLDQILSLYIALKGKKVEDVDIEFGSVVPERALTDKSTIVIEGLSQTQESQYGFNTQAWCSIASAIDCPTLSPRRNSPPLYLAYRRRLANILLNKIHGS